MLDRVLGREDHERRRELKSGSSDGHLSLLHGFEESRLHLGWSAINLVREEEMCKNRSFISVELRLRLIVYLSACEVSGEEVRRELDTGETESESTGDDLYGEGLRETGNSFEEDMSSGKKSDEDIADKYVLTDDSFCCFRAHRSYTSSDVFEGDF